MIGGQTELFARPVEDPLFACAAGQFSVGEAEVLIDALIEALAASLPETRHVMNLCTERHHFLLGFAAIIAAGKINLLPPNRQPDTLAELAERYGDVGLVHDGDDSGVSVDAQALDIRSIFGTDMGASVRARVDANPATDWRPSADREAVAAISFTSGSTGMPRANNKTWGMLCDGADINAVAMFEGASPGMSVLATVPPQHMYGLELSIMLPMRMDLCIHVGQPLFPADVVAGLKAMSHPRTLVTTPAHLRSLIADDDPLPSVERVFSATAPLDESLAVRTEQRFGGELIEIYGCSEVGSIACRRSARETSWQVFDGLQLVEATAIDGSSGDYRIAAQHLPEIAELQDRLELTAPNRFRLLGRREDLLNIAGKRGSLVQVNRRLLAIEGVVDGVAFQPGDGRLAAFVVAPTLQRSDVISALRQSLDPVFLPRPLVFVERLPRQASSKLRKRDLLALLDVHQAGQEGLEDQEALRSGLAGNSS